MNSSNALWHKPFGHVYIEKRVKDHPVTRRILDKLKQVNVIDIDNYAQIFNRNRQDFTLQKQAPSLILAEKTQDFYYNGSPFCEDFGAKRFYYTSSMMNCLYDCAYCFLKSLYACGHLVIFVNNNAFIQAVERDLLTGPALYLAISYESDLLALNPLTHFVEDWLVLAHHHPEMTLEIKTKSPAFSFTSPPPNAVFAWSLLPEEVIKRYEPRTPSLAARLRAIQKALDAHATVRLSLEPLLPIENSPTVYRRFAHMLADTLPLEAVKDINIGGFRISRRQFKTFMKKDPYSPVLAYPLIDKKDSVGYADEETLTQTLCDAFAPYVAPEKLVCYGPQS